MKPFTWVRAARAGAVAATLVGGLLASQASRAEQFINILTGGTSGVYYPMGVALSKVFSEKIKGVRPSVQSTKASVENLNLIQQGKGELAFTLGDAFADGWNGNAEAGFKKKLDKLRGVAGIYSNYIQIVASKDSGIKTLADLKGKRLSVGAPKSGTELNARAILGAAGIAYKDLGKGEYLPFGESVELIKNRQLDATLQSAGLGVASIRDLANSVPITVVEVPTALVDKIGAPYVKTVIPKGTYEGQTADVPTAAVKNYLVTNAKVPDDVVYGMVKSMFDSLSELRAAHAAAKGIALEGALVGMPAPLHPGAAKFYKEKGLIK